MGLMGYEATAPNGMLLTVKLHLRGWVYSSSVCLVVGRLWILSTSPSLLYIQKANCLSITGPGRKKPRLYLPVYILINGHAPDMSNK